MLLVSVHVVPLFNSQRTIQVGTPLSVVLFAVVYSEYSSLFVYLFTLVQVKKQKTVLWLDECACSVASAISSSFI